MPVLATAVAGLIGDFTPQEVFVEMQRQQAYVREGQSLAQFPNSPPDAAMSSLSSSGWLLAFATYCDGPEESSDYAAAAVMVRDTITYIAEHGVSSGSMIAMCRNLGLLYRRVMTSAPHLRTS